MYAIMKTMCPPGYHHNNSTSCAQVHELSQSHCVITGRVHCFHDCI